MIRPPLEYQLFIILFAGITGITIITSQPFWYLNILLVLLVLPVLVLTRAWRDRAFYLVCAGEPLVIACSIQNIWTGIFAIGILVGIICSVLGLFKSREDKKQVGLFLCISFVLALLVHLSNNVVLPLVILGAAAALILLGESVRMYQFKKQFTGDEQ